MPCFMALCFIVLYKCLSYKLKVCGNPVMNQPCWHDFLIAFAHFLPLSHFGNCHNVSVIFIMIIFAMVICDCDL